MSKQNNKKLYQSLTDKLENLKVELYENPHNRESIRLITASLDYLLVKLIKTELFETDIEEDLRLLIYHLNAIVIKNRIGKHQYLRISIKYLTLKAKHHIS